MVRLREIEKENIFSPKQATKLVNCRINKDVKPEQLKNYEIKSEGRIIIFSWYWWSITDFKNYWRIAFL